MHNVYIYDSNTADFSSIGLVGALLPFSCTHEEEAGGMSAITLTHPMDDSGKWKALARGRVLKVMTRVRTTPEIENGQVVTSVEIWTVKATATKNQRYLYSKKSGGAKKKLLPPGTEVVVVLKPLDGERYKVKTGKVAGWIADAALDYKTSETVADIEDVAAPWVVREQLFRIQSVEKDTDNQTVKVYAPHISYDLINNLTRFQSKEAVTAQEALAGIFGNCDHPHIFEYYTDLANTRTGADWLNINPMEALLDQENGFCNRFGAELIRDDTELYFLGRAGRNRGVRIEYGRNLLGVNYEVDEENVVTAILPTGVKKDGSLLYLTDDEHSTDNYVLSAHVSDYPIKRCAALACEGCTVGKQLTKELARARMREQAQAMFDKDECDLPSVNLKVQFLLLGDTEEYAQYRDLDRVCLYDEIPVIDKAHGIEVTATVQRLVIDCLTGRVEEAELGSVRECAASLSPWQIPSLDGGKLKPGTVPPSALEDESIPPEKLDPDLQDALNRAWEDIAGAQALLTDTRSWLDTVEATTETLQSAVTDNAGHIAALRISATEIRAGLTDAEKNLAAVSLTASQLQTAMTNAEGDISTIRQTANSNSSTIANQAGQISQIYQDVGRIEQTVKGDGGLVSQIQQLSDRVAIRLHNPAISSSFEAVVGNPVMGGAYAGLEFKSNDTASPYGAIGLMNAGGLFDAGLNICGMTDLQMTARGKLWLSAGGNVTSDLILKYDDRKGEMSAVLSGHFLPEAGNVYDLGGDGDGMRWRRLYTNNSVNTSDRRAKREIAPLNAEDLLARLIPVRYRLNDEPEGKLRFGFVAQDVEAALRDTDYGDANLLVDDNPERLGLVYTELIAVLAAGWQRHEREINTLKARIEALEGSA